MASRRVSSVDITFFSYATEEPAKVFSAVNNILPPDLRNKVEFKQTRLKGYFGNPILSYRGSVRRDDAYKLLKHVLTNLPETDLRLLLSRLSLHTDRGSLYMRLDKQHAFLGKLKLCHSDPIRLRVKFKVRDVEGITTILNEMVGKT
ncbi:hypothetical protein CP083_00355 [Candidatus Bathyarchaeota archaeon B24-2]|nr:MAG: hypothetical protein CP083_00355 [Candidatus Bathyarchaeota archaeon B24-2]